MSTSTTVKKKPIEITVWHRGQPIQKKRLRERIDKDRHLAYYDRGPGAAGYILPPLLGKKNHAVDHLVAPCYTIRPFLDSSFLARGMTGPGAGYYKIPDGMTHHGKFRQVGQHFGRKYDEKSRQKIPVGPGSHSLPKPDFYLYRSPAALILPYRPPLYTKYTDALYMHESMIGPKIITRLAAQAVSIKGDRKEKKPPKDTGPGPGSYDVKDPKRRPAWSMIGRPKLLRDDACVVGPKYSMEHIKNGLRAPAWSLGRKANEFTGILRYPCDAVNFSTLDKLL